MDLGHLGGGDVVKSPESSVQPAELDLAVCLVVANFLVWRSSYLMVSSSEWGSRQHVGSWEDQQSEEFQVTL